MSLGRSVRHVFSGLALAACGLLIAPSPALRAGEPDEIDQAIDAMLAAAKKDDVAEVTKWSIKLEEKPDSRVGEAFCKLAKDKNDEIAVLGYRKAAAAKAEDLLKLLKSKIGDKKLYKDHSTVAVAMLKACAGHDDKKLRKELVDVVKKYLPTEADFSCAAIEAYGSTRSVETIEQLMEWLAIVGTAGGGGQSGKNLSSETKDNYAKAQTAIMAALQSLTLMDFNDSKSWQDWWEESGGKDYELPDPNKVEEVPNFAELREYTDASYGYTIRLPKNPDGSETRPNADGEGPEAYWEFAASTLREGRVKARFLMKGEVQMRIEFCMFNTSGQAIQTPEQFNDFWVKDWKENTFDEIRGDLQPSELKIDGHDFIMNQAKGVSKGGSKGWGPREARIYISKIRHLVFYIFSDMRLGTEEDVMKAGYGIVESMTFKK